MSSMEENKLKIENAEKRLQENLKKIKHKLLVISGKGGVGKSTVAVNVAQAMVLQGKKVGILDVDIHGPSIAKMLGIETRRLLVPKEGEMPSPIVVKENFYAMSIATLIENPDEPIIWRGPLKIEAIKQFLQDIQWPQLDYLIIDSPPGTGDEPLSIVQTLKDVDGSLIVSTPQDIALLDARKTIKFSQKMNVPVLGIIENMSTFVCPHCREKIDIFTGLGVQKAATDFNIDILGKIPIDVNIVRSGDTGVSFLNEWKDSLPAIEFNTIVKKIIDKIG